MSAGSLMFRLAGSGVLLPGTPVPTAEVAARVGVDAAVAVRKTGIQNRHWAPELSFAEGGAWALEAALGDAGLNGAALERIILVTSTGTEAIIPTAANAIAALVGQAGHGDCLELNNGCMGFLTALDLAARCLATGSGPIAIVVAELGSHFITPTDPRPYLVFGDAIVALVLEPPTAGTPATCLVASDFRNDGRVTGNVLLASGSVTGQRETIRFGATNTRMGELAEELLVSAVGRTLARAGCGREDLAWFLPHQPNGRLLERFAAALDVPPERVVRVVDHIGSVGAASIPVSLHRLRQDGLARPGDLLLLAGVGAGVSCGAVLMRWGSA